MMKILIVSTNADEAGAPRHVETIVRGLASSFEFIIVFGENGPVRDRLQSLGYAVHVVEQMRTAINPIKDIIAFVKLFFLVVKYKPDLIHCHSAKAGMLGRIVAFFSKRPWIYTVHGWGWRGLSRLKSKIIVLIEWLLKGAGQGKFIFVANDVMDDAKRVVGIDGNMGEVIYNGVPRIELSLLPNDNEYTILMPARVSSAKDHKSLILGFELLNCVGSRLLLCGSGTDDPEFIALARCLAPTAFGRISFLGQSSNIGDIYSRCDVVTLISNFEALPLSVIEAMSCGKPIIATSVGGIPELIESETNGILVRPNCVDDIVEALIRYKDREVRAEYGKLAQIRYEERFTDKAMLTSISRIYHSLGAGTK